ncbi:hypothetical protein [Marispirochaeta sp.]|uniref:hypothetical protein n=1 Tax=Marispirochaeta sp. TaxID=2038653 RepID=UPI0029C6412D|nr:hypothetical protein [Marispirochaeta sp.]
MELNKVVLNILLIGLVGTMNITAMGRYETFDLDNSDYAFLTSGNDCSILYRGGDYLCTSKVSCEFFRSRYAFLNEEEYIVCNPLKVYRIDILSGEVLKSFDINIEHADFLSTTENENEILIGSNRKGLRLNIDTGEVKHDLSFAPDKYDANGNPTYPGIMYPFKIAYAVERNSFFFVGYSKGNNKVPKIYEYSLITNTIHFMVDGYAPQYVDELGRLFFIDKESREICYMDLSTGNVVSVLKVRRRSVPIIDYKYIDEKIFFGHLSDERTFKGFRFDEYKVYIDGKIYGVKTQGDLGEMPFDVILIDSDG